MLLQTRSVASSSRVLPAAVRPHWWRRPTEAVSAVIPEPVSPYPGNSPAPPSRSRREGRNPVALVEAWTVRGLGLQARTEGTARWLRLPIDRRRPPVGGDEEQGAPFNRAGVRLPCGNESRIGDRRQARRSRGARVRGA